jgi:hypothetical protein
MKNPYSSAISIAGFADWLVRPASEYSLVIGASCGCDVSRLGRVVCCHLNETIMSADGNYRAFGPNDIRQLAGDSRLRKAILDAAACKGMELVSGCDYECTVRAIAALGGSVLCGEWAFEKCADMAHVFRVALSHCDHCSPGNSMKLDPAGCNTEELSRIIAERFQYWSEVRMQGNRSRIRRPSSLPILV